MTHPRVLFSAAFAIASAVASACAFGQAYPSKPIRFVLGFPAGSSTDIVSRIVTDDMRERTGATIVIENKPGALGALGMDAVVRAAPDGYTVMSSSSATTSSGPHLSRAIQKFDPATSMTHLGRLATFDIAVATSANGPYKTARSLIDAAKARPEALTYGYGSATGQVGSAGFSRAAGINVRAIPYKGQPQAVTDVLGGQVDFVSSDLGALLSFIKAGSLVPVAVLADKRSTIIPDVPTAAEVGLPNFGLGGWIGVDGPGKLPADVIAWWATQMRLSLEQRTVQEKLRNIGIEPAPLFGEPFNKFVATEYERWGKHVREAGIQPE